MAVPDQSAQITWLFNLSALTVEEDIAEFSIWVEPVASITDWDTELLRYAEAGLDAWTSEMPPAYWATNVSLGSVKATHFNPAGHTTNEQVAVPSTPWVGIDASAALPWETSVACSLYTYTPGTFIPNGKRRRGRFYLPPMAASILDHSNTGFFDNATINTLLTHCHDFVGKVALDFPGVAHTQTPSVFSRVDSHLYMVTDIVIDAKIDSQRRRQNREVAGRISQGITF